MSCSFLWGSAASSSVHYPYPNMSKLKPYKTWFTAIVCLWLAACAVQQTRVQHGTIPVAFVPTEEEDAYGKRIFTSLSEDHPPDTHSQRYDQLNGVFDHLAESVAIGFRATEAALARAPQPLTHDK